MGKIIEGRFGKLEEPAESDQREDSSSGEEMDDAREEVAFERGQKLQAMMKYIAGLANFNPSQEVQRVAEEYWSERSAEELEAALDESDEFLWKRYPGRYWKLGSRLLDEIDTSNGD